MGTEASLRKLCPKERRCGTEPIVTPSLTGSRAVVTAVVVATHPAAMVTKGKRAECKECVMSK